MALIFPAAPNINDTWPSPREPNLPVWQWTDTSWKMVIGAGDALHDGYTYGRKDGAWQEIVPVDEKKTAIIEQALLPDPQVLTINMGISSGQWIYLANGHGMMINGSLAYQALPFHLAAPGTAGTTVNWRGAILVRPTEFVVPMTTQPFPWSTVKIGGLGLATVGFGSVGTFGFLWGGGWGDYNAYISVDGGHWRLLTNLCDERFKEDIVSSSFDCLSAVKSIPLYQFRWKNRKNKEVVPCGVVAQRLKDVAPWLVAVEPQVAPKNGEKFNAMQTDVNGVMSLLVGAIQQLTKEVEALEAMDHGSHQ